MLYTLIKHVTMSQSEFLLEWLKQSTWLYKIEAVKNVRASKLKNHHSSHSTIVYKLNSIAGRI